jgi:predicted RNA-binding Zn-ribbon protein involved in translation (DUF1610 family)
MYTEIKYLNLLSVRLEKFKKKKDYLWNFRCPICGDSQRNKNKCRGFVFQVKGSLLYKCHNCQYSVPLPKLIEDLDPALYSQYRLEKFQEGKKRKPDMRKVERIVSTTPVFKVDVLSSLIPITELNKEHPARQYLLNRKVPIEALYFTEKFQEWTNSVKPGTFEDGQKDEPRIIIPFKDKEGNTFGYQGRSIHNSGLRYITILLQEGQPKIFGLNTLDYDKTIYITEGPFDSLFVENCIAMAGADLSGVSDLGDNVVFIFDNEPRNKQITSRVDKLINSGHSVVIWPSYITQKDINDMFLAGIPVQNIIESNTYNGLKATLKFNEWRK